MTEQATQAERRRRDHSPAFKRELIERSLQSGASVSGIALEGGVNANLLFRWRREHLRAGGQALVSATATPVLLPVKIASPIPQPFAAPMPAPRPAPRADSGSIEIEIGGARVVLRGTVDESSLRLVLQTLRGAA